MIILIDLFLLGSLLATVIVHLKYKEKTKHLLTESTTRIEEEMQKRLTLEEQYKKRGTGANLNIEGNETLNSLLEDIKTVRQEKEEEIRLRMESERKAEVLKERINGIQEQVNEFKQFDHSEALDDIKDRIKGISTSLDNHIHTTLKTEEAYQVDYNKKAEEGEKTKEKEEVAETVKTTENEATDFSPFDEKTSEADSEKYSLEENSLENKESKEDKKEKEDLEGFAKTPTDEDLDLDAKTESSSETGTHSQEMEDISSFEVNKDDEAKTELEEESAPAQESSFPYSEEEKEEEVEEIVAEKADAEVENTEVKQEEVENISNNLEEKKDVASEEGYKVNDLNLEYDSEDSEEDKLFNKDAVTIKEKAVKAPKEEEEDSESEESSESSDSGAEKIPAETEKTEAPTGIEEVKTGEVNEDGIGLEDIESKSVKSETEFDKDAFLNEPVKEEELKSNAIDKDELQKMVDETLNENEEKLKEHEGSEALIEANKEEDSETATEEEAVKEKPVKAKINIKDRIEQLKRSVQGE